MIQQDGSLVMLKRPDQELQPMALLIRRTQHHSRQQLLRLRQRPDEGVGVVAFEAMASFGEVEQIGHRVQQHCGGEEFRVERDRIWYIGVPLRGDMERLESQCRERGLDLQRVSWRP